MSPLALSLDDFKIASAVCEIRYEDAFLLFDRSGQICVEARTRFTDCEVVSAVPNQTILKAKEGAFAVELKLCRFTTTTPDRNLEAFATNCKKFFDSVFKNLDVKVFTRIGLRVVFRKDYKDLEETKAALTSLNLLNIPPAERFGAASEPREMIFRWEGTQIGAVLRLSADRGKINVFLPPELELEQSEIQKSIIGLSVDVDYYTLAPVERSQWDPVSWIPHSVRIVRMQTDALLGS